MTFEEWLNSVSSDLKGDTLWKMKVYRLSLFASDLAWFDASKLIKDKRTVDLSTQLYRAVGSISANIAEGYSRRSGKDRARFYEYALGSARESRGWYYQGRHILTMRVAMHRISLLTQIIQLLLHIISPERERNLREQSPIYEVDNPNNLLDNPPLP